MNDQDKTAIHPLLRTLGTRVLQLRTAKGFTRKQLAELTDVSERHLANLEYGRGNVSVLMLAQIAQAFHLPVHQLLMEKNPTDTAPTAAVSPSKNSHIVALIGLRGAGKSSLGQMLAQQRKVPFIELSRVIEQLAGCKIAEIQALYGANAYRRYEKRALEDSLSQHSAAIIATPGGIVTDAELYPYLLRHSTTVWLQAAAEDHMQRVVAQGDMRPMAANPEAMSDLKQILASRSGFYSQADFTLNTSAAPLAQTFEALLQILPKPKAG